jgi:hypothetical protein
VSQVTAVGDPLGTGDAEADAPADGEVTGDGVGVDWPQAASTARTSRTGARRRPAVRPEVEVMARHSATAGRSAPDAGLEPVRDVRFLIVPRLGDESGAA